MSTCLHFEISGADSFHYTAYLAVERPSVASPRTIAFYSSRQKSSFAFFVELCGMASVLMTSSLPSVPTKYNCCEKKACAVRFVHEMSGVESSHSEEE